MYNYTFKIHTITESKSQYVHIHTCETTDVTKIQIIQRAEVKGF